VETESTPPPPEGREVLLAVALALAGSGAVIAGQAAFDRSLPFALIVAIQAALFAAAAWFPLASRASPAAALGFRRPTGRIVVAGAAGALALLLGSLMVNLAMTASLGRGLRLPKAVEEQVTAESGGGLAIALVGIAIAVPLAEEMFFRGLLLRWLDERFGFAAAALLSAAAFSLAHLPRTIDWAALAFVSGLLLATLLRATRNLWAPCVAHALVNSTAVLAAVAAPR
jgi:membrane protease YdiL (CAAX protease family)